MLDRLDIRATSSTAAPQLPHQNSVDLSVYSLTTSFNRVPSGSSFVCCDRSAKREQFWAFVDRSDHTFKWSGDPELSESQLAELERSLVHRYNHALQLEAGAVVIDAKSMPVETSRCID